MARQQNVQSRNGSGGRRGRTLRATDAVWQSYRARAVQDDASLSFIMAELLAGYGAGQIHPSISAADIPVRRKNGSAPTVAHAVSIPEATFVSAMARAKREGFSANALMAALAQDYAEKRLSLPTVERTFS